MDFDQLREWRRAQMNELSKVVGGKAALGRALGYADGAFIGQMIRGERPITEKTILEIDALPGRAGWFDRPHSTSSTFRAPTASSDEGVFFDLDAHPDLERVRKVNLRLEAGVNGFSIESEEGEGEPVFFRKKWLSSRGYKSVNLIAIKVMGNSMEPNLYPDDLVVINTADTEPKDGKVFAVNYEGEPVVKRMVRDGGSWWLSSDNPDQKRFGRKECSGTTCLIIGRVIHKQSEQI